MSSPAGVRVASRVTGWWYEPVPQSRAALLRTGLALFVVWDVLGLTPWVSAHGYVPAELYRPLLIPRVLHLPVPTVSLVVALQVVLVVAALVTASGRLPRLAGGVLAMAYTQWMFVAMSYGKIDHDRFALLVALWVLPTVGRAGFLDKRPSQAAGWALRCIQLAVVLTYFLAAWAKMRWGGWGWAGGETFYWAMSRRGTDLGALLLEVPWTLHLGQWMVLLAEFTSPLLLVVRERWRLLGLAFFAVFHLMTWLTIMIHFLPHVVCLAAFLPLERVARWLRRASGRVRRTAAATDAAHS